MPVSAGVLRTHLDYTTWASLRLLNAAAQLTPEELTHDFHTADRSILHTLVHIFAADRIWFSRVTGAPPHGFVSDADRSLPALQSGWPALLEHWKFYASSLTDGQELTEIAYNDLKGKAWKTPLWQLILHVVNHGTHHRGQVSGFLRSLGRTPPYIDLIHYYREM